MNPKELQERLTFSRKAVASVVPLILDGFQNSKLQVERKRDGSHVTEIDRKVEELLRREIESAFRGERIVGEEFGDSGGASSDLCWYIDPIDGTCSFIAGVPLFGTMIGLVENGKPIFGYVYLPGLDEAVHAFKGGGCWWKPSRKNEVKKTSVSGLDRLSDSIFSSTSRDGFVQAGRLGLYDRLCEEADHSRGWSDCYGHLLVATARADLMIDAVCNDWDAVPFQVIIEEAGGVFCDLRGEKTAFGKSMVSMAAGLESEVLDLLRNPDS